MLFSFVQLLVQLVLVYVVWERELLKFSGPITEELQQFSMLVHCRSHCNSTAIIL